MSIDGITLAPGDTLYLTMPNGHCYALRASADGLYDAMLFTDNRRVPVDGCSPLAEGRPVHLHGVADNARFDYDTQDPVESILLVRAKEVM